MRYLSGMIALFVVFSANAAENLLDVKSAINGVRTACSGIAEEINDLKKMAGINTAITGVGTVAGGVALGAGIKKSNIDADIKNIKSALLKNAENDNAQYNEISESQVQEAFENAHNSEKDKPKQTDNLSDLEKKSKTLGNIRTGTLAASTAANIAGVVIAKDNKVKDVLKSKIANCVASVKTLSMTRMQARLDNSANNTELEKAEKIISACGEYETVDVDSINKRSKGAMLSSGLGAGLGLAGTITSAQANKATENVEQKNTTANILAGGTTAASAVATVFNATQIKAIKRVATVSDNCMEALQ